MFNRLFNSKLNQGIRQFSNMNYNGNTHRIEELLKSLNIATLVVGLNIVVTNYILVQQSKK